MRIIVVLNLDGDLQHTYAYDKDGQVDRVNEQWEGRVIGLDYGGQILWTYKGCDINFITGKFYPSDITIISNHMLLVSDQNNNAIHVLNYNGEIFACKAVKELDIE